MYPEGTIKRGEPNRMERLLKNIRGYLRQYAGTVKQIKDFLASGKPELDSIKKILEDKGMKEDAIQNITMYIDDYYEESTKSAVKQAKKEMKKLLEGIEKGSLFQNQFLVENETKNKYIDVWEGLKKRLYEMIEKGEVEESNIKSSISLLKTQIKMVGKKKKNRMCKIYTPDRFYSDLTEQLRGFSQYCVDKFSLEFERLRNNEEKLIKLNKFYGVKAGSLEEAIKEILGTKYNEELQKIGRIGLQDYLFMLIESAEKDEETGRKIKLNPIQVARGLCGLVDKIEEVQMGLKLIGKLEEINDSLIGVVGKPEAEEAPAQEEAEPEDAPEVPEPVIEPAPEEELEPEDADIEPEKLEPVQPESVVEPEPEVKLAPVIVSEAEELEPEKTESEDADVEPEIEEPEPEDADVEPEVEEPVIEPAPEVELAPATAPEKPAPEEEPEPEETPEVPEPEPEVKLAPVIVSEAEEQEQEQEPEDADVEPEEPESVSEKIEVESVEPEPEKTEPEEEPEPIKQFRLELINTVSTEEGVTMMVKNAIQIFMQDDEALIRYICDVLELDIRLIFEDTEEGLKLKYDKEDSDILETIIRKKSGLLLKHGYKAPKEVDNKPELEVEGLIRGITEKLQRAMLIARELKSKKEQETAIRAGLETLNEKIDILKEIANLYREKNIIDGEIKVLMHEVDSIDMSNYHSEKIKELKKTSIRGKEVLTKIEELAKQHSIESFVPDDVSKQLKEGTNKLRQLNKGLETLNYDETEHTQFSEGLMGLRRFIEELTNL